MVLTMLGGLSEYQHHQQQQEQRFTIPCLVHYNIYETLGLEMPAYNLIEKLQVNTDPLRPSLPPPHHPRGLTKRNRNTTLVKDLDIVLMKTLPCLTFCIIFKGRQHIPEITAMSNVVVSPSR